jgi:hypothetical protein
MMRRLVDQTWRLGLPFGTGRNYWESDHVLLPRRETSSGSRSSLSVHLDLHRD